MFFEAGNAGASQHLFHQPVHDFDSGQVALVDGPVKTLAGKRLLVEAAVGIAVEEAADFIFKFDARAGGWRGSRRGPGAGTSGRR